MCGETISRLAPYTVFFTFSFQVEEAGILETVMTEIQRKYTKAKNDIWNIFAPQIGVCGPTKKIMAGVPCTFE